MNNNRNNSFWPSYVDIMTTLFAIMLILFVVSFSRFKVKEKQLQTLVDEYDNIITVYSTVGEIDSTRYFGYNEQYLKHLFTVDVQYQQKEYAMNKLLLDVANIDAANDKRDSVITAGKIIQKTLMDLGHNTVGGSKNNIKFLVILEGQASKVGFNEDSWRNNYTLSYLRAQHLNEFWKANGVNLETIPRCELIISGSGEGGVPRYIPNEKALRNSFPDQKDYLKHWVEEEGKNQRFLVHVVPVIGNIDVTKEKIDSLRNQ